MLNIKFLYNVLLINTLFILKCYSKKRNYMYVGKELYFTTIEDALQECTNNFIGLKDTETSIFIEAGTYEPRVTFRSSIFGETSTINFIGEGIDKTIIECNNLNRLIGLEMNNKNSNNIWTFKDMTFVGCKNTNIETVKVTINHIIHFHIIIVLIKIFITCLLKVLIIKLLLLL